MTDRVQNLWPELMWISDADLREKTARTWELALEKSVLTPEDLNRIPFTLLASPDLKVTFMAHKRCVVHIARDAGNKMNEFFKDDLPVNMDVLIAGAILADVGKLLEYEMKDGKSVQGMYGNTSAIHSPESHLPNNAAYLRQSAISSPLMPAKAIW